MQKLLPSSLLLGLAACGGGTTKSPAVVTTGTTALRIASADANPGDGDALAGSLLLSSGLPVLLPGRPDFRMSDRALADELVFRGLSHLQATAFASAAGPSGAGSERIRRLAKDPNAPVDGNDNGTNLDEVWAAELAALSQAAGAGALDIGHPMLFPWSRASAALANPVQGKTEDEVPAWRTVATGDDLVLTEQVGAAMKARVLAAIALLSENRGDQLGADSTRGRLGALLLQQAVAAEETLVASLFFDGTSLGRLASPASYDPRNGKRWVPLSFRVSSATAPEGAPEGYTPVGRGSSLTALANLLEAEAQLAWLGSDTNPSPTLRDLMHGRPFGEASTPRKPRQTQAQIVTNGLTEVTWTTDIKPLFDQYYCSSCHNSTTGNGLFDSRTYESVLRGGEHQATNPSVVKGNARASLLYQSLIGDVLSIGVHRMPSNGPFLSAGEASLVADWIDGGAKKEPSIPIPPPRIGQDVARALVKNLGAMHFDASTGAFYDRNDGDAPVRWVSTSSTGAALGALALWLEVVPTDSDARSMLQIATDFARTTLVDAADKVVAGFDLDNGVATGDGTLFDHARLCAALFAAGRALDDTQATVAARRIGTSLVSATWWDDKTSLFRTDLARQGRRYTGPVLDATLTALRELAADGSVTGAAAIHDKLLGALRPFLAYSEWDGAGEVLGDGIPDTDGNGIKEPASAGSGNGLLPMLVGEILQGPAPAQEATTVPEPITWTRHVSPLFRATCVGCHVDGAFRGNYRLDTPTQARTPGDSLGAYPLIVPGNPEGSLLYRMLVDRIPAYGHQMPLQQPPLDDRGKELVRLWIEQGATSR